MGSSCDGQDIETNVPEMSGISELLLMFHLGHYTWMRTSMAAIVLLTLVDQYVRRLCAIDDAASIGVENSDQTEGGLTEVAKLCMSHVSCK